MDRVLEELTLSGYSFVKRFGGTMSSPYATYRRLIESGRRSELIYIGLVCLMYFALASVVKTQAFRPFLLTRQFLLLAGGTGVGYCLMVIAMYYCSLLFGGKGKLTQMALAWGYSLVPTAVWFLATSLLYVVLPPPRTEAPLGVLFSLIYLLFSAVLFFWKAELYYLTLRFGMKLNLQKIIMVTAIILPLAGIYSVAMYTTGIFRVPFL